MKKLITVLLLALATTVGNAQCFTLRENVSNSLITCNPDAGAPFFGYFYKAAAPTNTRKISWNSQTPVEARYQVYGYGYDSPATPYFNESVLRIDFINEFVPLNYGATVTKRFSECDVEWLSDFQTSHLREFVMEVILYQPGTGRIINRGYMRWTR